MSMKNKISKLNNQTGTARAVLNVLNVEDCGPALIVADVYKAISDKGGRIALDRIEGTLKSLLRDGLISGSFSGGFYRQMVVPKGALAKIEAAEEAEPEAPGDDAATSFGQETPDSLMERGAALARRLRDCANMVEGIVTEAAESIEQARAEGRNATDSLAAIKALVGGAK